MSLCRFERQLGDVAYTLARAKAEAVKFRSVWEGDEEKGYYVLRTPLGTVEGKYTVDAARVCHFEIDKKPMVVPCALIHRVLDQFLRSV
jgi:hypothetical protein